MVSAVGAATALSIAFYTQSARAQSTPPDFEGGDRGGDSRPASAPLTVAIDEEVRVVTPKETLRCSGPCTLTVPTGFVRVTAGDRTADVLVEGASRVTKTAGAPGLRTLGLGLIGGGVLVLVAAVGIPLLVCQTEYPTDAFGQRLPSRNPCRDIPDGVKVAWIGGAGIGLTAATLGVITYAAAAPRIRLEPSAPATPPTAASRVRLVPWLVPSSREVGAAPAGGGALVIGTF